MKTDDADTSRQNQDEMYHFPYHHLVDFNPNDGQGFVQHQEWPRGYVYASYMLHVLNAIEDHNINSIIDIGCGDALFTKKMAERYKDKEIAGVDISAQAINLAKAMYPEASFKLEIRDIIHDNTQKLYNGATLIEVLEHIPVNQVDAFIFAVSKQLVQDGVLFITVPSVNLPIIHIKRHFQHFTSESLRNALEPYFNIERIEYLNVENRATRRIISKLFTNSLFIINSQKWRNVFFQHYYRHYTLATAANGTRVFAIGTKK